MSLVPKKKFLNEDEDDKSIPLPSALNYGPLENRGCTDFLCCTLFALFWAGLIVIAGVAFNQGDPRRLASPFDVSGNQCGYGLAADYPYMYLSGDTTNLTSGMSACVKSCPNSKDSTIECLPNKTITDCSLLSYIDSIPFVTLCLPNVKERSEIILKQLNLGSTEEWMSDIKTTWPISLAITFIAFAVSMLFLVLMRKCSGVITWTMILGYFTALTTLGFSAINKANSGNFSNVPASFQTEKVLEATGYILLVTAAISLVLFIFFFNRIRRSIAIMKAASDFTREVWQTSIVPVIMFIFIAAFFSFWVVSSLYIYSSGEFIVNSHSPFGSVNWNESMKNCLLYFVFGLFWNVEFFIAMSQLIIASCAAMWYFSHRPNTKLVNPVSRSIGRAVFLHIGSVCFGSLVLSIVEMIKLMVELVYKEMKKNLNSSNTANYCMRCCLCCLRFFEDFIRFINTNAYIMISLTGFSFCESAKTAFSLINRNSSQFSITQGIGNIFVFIGKLFISAISSLAGYALITQVDMFSSKIYSAGAPTLLFGVISYCIASVFMNIYGMAADSLLMCLSCDKELNRGRPASCPTAIQQFEEDHMR